MPLDQLPDIFTYLNYRRYLHDVVEFMKAKDGLSVRKISAIFGFASTSYLKRVVDGQRSILPKTARQIGKAIGLSENEVSFFIHLIEYNHAKDNESRDLQFKKLLGFRRFVQCHRLTAAEYELFAKWYIPGLLEMIKTDFAYEEPTLMAEALGISKEEALAGLDVLERLGLIQRTNEGLKQLHPSRQTEAETKSHFIAKYHQQMLERAFQASKSIPLEERGFGGLTVALGPGEFEEFKKRLFAFFQELNSQATQALGDREVYQINFQIFPLTQRKIIKGSKSSSNTGKN